MKQGKPAAAEAPALAALEKQPTHPVAVAALGESLVGQARYVAAIERMTAAIAKNDKLAYAYYWRAHAYSKNKQPARMVDDLEVFLSLAPDAPEAPDCEAASRHLPVDLSSPPTPFSRLLHQGRRRCLDRLVGGRLSGLGKRSTVG